MPPERGVRSEIALGGGALEVDSSSCRSDSGNCGCSRECPMSQRQLIVAEASK